MTSTVTPPIVSTPSSPSTSSSNHPNYESMQSTGHYSTRERGDDENSNEPLPSDVYPPTNNDEVDTSRVVENLRRWEVAERQRRKAARESAANSYFPSVMGDITKLLWPGRKTSKGFGTHVALQSQEHIGSVSLRHFDISPSPSPISSPPHRRSEESHPDNPFANPPESLPSFHASRGQQQPSASSSTSGPSPSILPTSASISGLQVPPTPRPLDLPSVETSPRTTNTPPPPTSSPAPILYSAPTDGNQREGRWWHDWLCGCGEGPDRGGDCQAGRTNPFE